MSVKDSTQKGLAMAGNVAKFGRRKRKRKLANRQYWQKFPLGQEQFQCVELPDSWLCRLQVGPGNDFLYASGPNPVTAMSSIQARHLLDPWWQDEDDRIRYGSAEHLTDSEIELADKLADLYGIDRGRALAAGLHLLLLLVAM
jgi:hypothetical protein